MSKKNNVRTSTVTISPIFMNHKMPDQRLGWGRDYDVNIMLTLSQDESISIKNNAE
jgi:hypothetical protein